MAENSSPRHVVAIGRFGEHQVRSLSVSSSPVAPKSLWISPLLLSEALSTPTILHCSCVHLLLCSLAPAFTCSSCNCLLYVSQLIQPQGLSHGPCPGLGLTAALRHISPQLPDLIFNRDAPCDPNSLGDWTIDSIPLVSWICSQSRYIPPFHR